MYLGQHLIKYILQYIKSMSLTCVFRLNGKQIAVKCINRKIDGYVPGKTSKTKNQNKKRSKDIHNYNMAIYTEQKSYSYLQILCTFCQNLSPSYFICVRMYQVCMFLSFYLLMYLKTYIRFELSIYTYIFYPCECVSKKNYTFDCHKMSVIDFFLIVEGFDYVTGRNL